MNPSEDDNPKGNPSSHCEPPVQGDTNRFHVAVVNKLVDGSGK